MKGIFLIFILSLARASVDDKTSPFADKVANQFYKTSQGKSFDCPFSDKKKDCDDYLNQRTISGICNNLKNTLFGSSGTPHKRLLSPQYNDGFSTPRIKAVSGKELPNPRLISNALNTDVLNTQEQIWTNLWTSFGQFISHDVTATALPTGIVLIDFI